MISKDKLVALGVPALQAEQYLPSLNRYLPDYRITGGSRQAHFLAQILHESARLTRMTENLNYSARGLRATWPSRFKSTAAAQPYHRKPEKIANRVYSNRMGNGPESSGDGWKYRGRGAIQLTGRSNYEQLAEWAGIPEIVEDPDLVADKYAILAAVFYWDSRKLNRLADQDDLVAITKAINGGTHGLQERRQMYNRARRIL